MDRLFNTNASAPRLAGVCAARSEVTEYQQGGWEGNLFLAWLPPFLIYFRSSATFAIPALAQASSISWLDPELPTPPIVSLPT